MAPNPTRDMILATMPPGCPCRRIVAAERGTAAAQPFVHDLTDLNRRLDSTDAKLKELCEGYTNGFIAAKA